MLVGLNPCILKTAAAARGRASLYAELIGLTNSPLGLLFKAGCSCTVAGCSLYLPIVWMQSQVGRSRDMGTIGTKPQIGPIVLRIRTAQKG